MNESETKQISEKQSLELKTTQKDHLSKYQYTPGQSGNPSGRPKQTKETKQLLKDIRELGPKAYAALVSILDSEKVQAMAKVKAIELVLNYALGKPENNIKLSIDPAQQTIASEMRIAALVQSIQVQLPQAKSPVIMENNYTPEQMQRMGLIVPDEAEEEDQ